jgi:hypothetical protein
MIDEKTIRNDRVVLAFEPSVSAKIVPGTRSGSAYRQSHKQPSSKYLHLTCMLKCLQLACSKYVLNPVEAEEPVSWRVRLEPDSVASMVGTNGKIAIFSFPLPLPNSDFRRSLLFQPPRLNS